MTLTARYHDLEGCPVLITGGGTGIGAALTEGFIRQGAKVAFIDIAEAPSRELCARLQADVGAAPLYISADLRERFADIIPTSIPVFPSGEWEKAVNDGWYRAVAPNVDPNS